MLGVKHYGARSLHKRTLFLMGTYCTMQVFGTRDVLKSIDMAFNRMKEIDVKYNVLQQESPLYEFNRTNSAITDKEIIGLIKTALRISKESKGAFDITIYPLMKLWGFYEDSPMLPEKEKINQYRMYTGYENLIINNNKLTKLKDRIGIDLGGIAKGYAIGEAVRVLKEQGITSALIDAGGDIYALGKLQGKNWKIGIRNPREEGIIGVLDVSDCAVVTSGDYERFFEEDGIRYHHLLDPRTGYPAQKLISVTVISPDPVHADAWSTALFVLGDTVGLKLVEKTPDMEVIMITHDKKIIYSSGLSDCFEIIKDLPSQ